MLADRHVIPEAESEHYAEQVIHLPESFMAGEFATASGAVPNRAAAGLPEAGVVFCCFNTPYKISPAMFAAWMRILLELPEAVLWLRETTAAVKGHLALEAERHGRLTDDRLANGVDTRAALNEPVQPQRMLDAPQCP